MPNQLSDEKEAYFRRLLEKVGESEARLRLILLAAQQHGTESEADHEVGDLQQALRACWERLPIDDQRLVFTQLGEWLDEWLPAT